jgi:prepilin-type N-terminal cleavage/methylation domain-containing protein
MSSIPKRRRGFTLFETMTVVGIVGILSAIAVPSLRHIKKKAEDTLSRNTILPIYNAEELYFTEDAAGKTYVTVRSLIKAG